MGRPQRTVKQVEKFHAYEPGSKHVPIFLRVANRKEKKKEAKQKDKKNEKRREKRKVKDDENIKNTPGTSHTVCIKDKVDGTTTPTRRRSTKGPKVPNKAKCLKLYKIHCLTLKL